MDSDDAKNFIIICANYKFFTFLKFLHEQLAFYEQLQLRKSTSDHEKVKWGKFCLKISVSIVEAAAAADRRPVIQW